MPFRQLQKYRPRFAKHALLNVKFRQPLQRLHFLRRQLRNFFVYGDGLGQKSIANKYLREARKIIDRLKCFALTHIQIAHGHQRHLIPGLVLQNLLIFHDSQRHAVLPQMFLRRFNVFDFAVCHYLFCSTIFVQPDCLRRGLPSRGQRVATA